ncbi:MAG: hypothetical protein KDB07_03295 [Planctomycetes bacterium]|nr:hypothetical protein [Planctomycetota bacterium]
MDALTIAIIALSGVTALVALGLAVVAFAIWNLGRMGESMPAKIAGPQSPARQGFLEARHAA